jgi:hypothetical protein
MTAETALARPHPPRPYATRSHMHTTPSPPRPHSSRSHTLKSFCFLRVCRTLSRPTVSDCVTTRSGLTVCLPSKPSVCEAFWIPPFYYSYPPKRSSIFLYSEEVFNKNLLILNTCVFVRYPRRKTLFKQGLSLPNS